MAAYTIKLNGVDVTNYTTSNPVPYIDQNKDRSFKCTPLNMVFPSDEVTPLFGQTVEVLSDATTIYTGTVKYIKSVERQREVTITAVSDLIALQDYYIDSDTLGDIITDGRTGTERECYVSTVSGDYTGDTFTMPTDAFANDDIIMIKNQHTSWQDKWTEADTRVYNYIPYKVFDKSGSTHFKMKRYVGAGGVKFFSPAQAFRGSEVNPSEIVVLDFLYFDAYKLTSSDDYYFDSTLATPYVDVNVINMLVAMFALAGLTLTYNTNIDIGTWNFPTGATSYNEKVYIDDITTDAMGIMGLNQSTLGGREKSSRVSFFDFTKMFVGILYNAVLVPQGVGAWKIEQATSNYSVATNDVYDLTTDYRNPKAADFRCEWKFGAEIGFSIVDGTDFEYPRWDYYADNAGAFKAAYQGTPFTFRSSGTRENTNINLYSNLMLGKETVNSTRYRGFINLAGQDTSSDYRIIQNQLDVLTENESVNQANTPADITVAHCIENKINIHSGESTIKQNGAF